MYLYIPIKMDKAYLKEKGFGEYLGCCLSNGKSTITSPLYHNIEKVIYKFKSTTVTLSLDSFSE